MEKDNKEKVTETLESTVVVESNKSDKGSNKTIMIIAIVLGLLLLCCCVVMTIFVLFPSLNATKTDTTGITISTTTPTTSPTKAVVTTIAPTATTNPSAGIGDIVTKDNVEWKVLSAENLGDTITSTNQFMPPIKSSGNWISVRLEVKNVGTKAKYFVDPQIIDSLGTKYLKSTETMFYVPADEYPILENMNPGIAKTFTIIYDVPKTSTGLQLLVGELLINTGARIDLGI